MSSLTPNFSLILPGVGDPTDQDLWGGYLNSDLTSIDGLLKVARDTVTASVTTGASLTSADRNTAKLLDATGGAFNLQMPDPTSVANGFHITFKKIDSSGNSVTLQPFASEKFDGASTVTITAQYSTLTFVTNGTDWFQIASNIQGGSAVVGSMRNLKIVCPGNSANIAVIADELVLENSSSGYQTVRNVSLSINSAGTGANGLDTGAIAINTWYYIYVIYNSSTVSGLISLSSTAPTLPSGYTYAARVGSMRTDSTANKYPLGTIQYGRKVQYTVGAGNVPSLPSPASGSLGTMAGGNVTAYSTVSLANFISPLAVRYSGTSSIGLNGSQFVAPNSSWTGSYSSASQAPGIAVSGTTGALSFDFLAESLNMYAANLGAGVVYISGWEENL